MLNMINLKDMDVFEETSLYLLHFGYVFMVSVLLLNFLIAIFSDPVNIVNENHDVIYDIQRLSIIYTVQERVLDMSKIVFIFSQKTFHTSRW